MRNTGSSGRSKSNKDKGSSKTSQPQTQNSSTVKPEGPPVKTIQPTAEQVALTNLIHKDTEDAELQNKIKQIMELTGCSQDKAEIALYDNKNDLDRAVNMLFEGNTDEGEWRESGKKKKKQSQNKQDGAAQNENTDTKPEKRDNKDRNDRDNRDRDREDGDNDRNNRDQSDNYRRPRRNDNRPPRLSRGRGRPDRAGDRPEKDDDNDREDHRERGGFERGRGRGRGFGGGPRRGRGGGGGSTGGNFRGNQSRFDKTSQFDNGPQIDTWTNETAVIGEKEPKITNWSDSKEDWNEDIDSWTGSLAETKVFTASTAAAPEPPVQLDTSTLSNTFDLSSVLYNSQKQNDISAEASYINQFNQQATESIKNSIGIGSGSTSSLQNSMNSQTASNVSALVSIQNALQQDPMGPSLSAPELAGNSLSGNSLTGNGFVGTSLGNSLSANSIPVNSLTGSGLNSTSLSGSSLSGSSLTGAGLSGSGLTGSLTASSLSSVAQSIAAAVPSVIPTSSVSQNAMLQQRQKPQRSKLPPPSKIPASAVEMPGHMMTTLDVQFGNLEFGTDSSPFSFGGNESVPNAYSSSASSSTSTNNHVNAQVGQVPLTKSSETMIPSSIMSSGLEQSSPRNSGLYQQSPYTTPTKQNSAENTPKIQSPPEPIQMPGNTTDLKSNQLMSGQTAQVSLPSTKIDSNLSSYSSGSSYQSSGYQAHKPSAGFPSSKPGSYPGNQYQSGSNQNQSGSGQYSSQFGRQSNQNQYQNSSTNQYQSASAYQSPPSGYQSSQTGYQSSQSQYQSNQSQYQSNPNQFQNYQSGSTFQNQSNYPSNQSNQNSLYQTTTASFSSQSQSNSLYSQSSSHTGSYPNQYLNREHASGAGTSYQPPVTQSNSPFKDNQAGASSYRDSTNKSRDTPSDSSYNRDTQSASSFSDSQSLAYNRDSQSVGSSYSRDSSSSSYKRDSKSAGGAYSRDAQSGDNSSFKRDSQSASGSYNSRDNQSFKDTQSSNFRDNQSGTSYGNQTGSYQRDSSQSSLGAGASQTQGSYSAKNYRNNTDMSTSALQTSLPGSKLVDSFSKMGVKEGNLDNRVTSASQFDVAATTASKSSASTVSLPASTTTLTTSATASTTVTSSNTAKLSTLPTSTSSSSKAPPNLPPGVPLMAQQYIMGQANTLPFYGLQGLQGLQQPLYANIEEFQYLQQRMPPLAANNVYDMTATAAAAAALPIPPTTLTSNSTQPNVPTVPFSGTADSTKMTRVDAQSPTGSVPTTQQSGQAHQQQPQPPYILNYSYYYPPSLIPGAGFQYPMIPMPQVTNAAHAGSPANSQYQQKSYGSHHMQYGTNKVYDELTQQTPDFSKSPYGGSQSQQKASANSSVTPGSVSSDIQVPGYGKTHAQAFDKQGFHAGTPPPFNLQMAAGQLTTGTQAGPLGAHTAPYGAPFVPMMTHQPHSQVMHHPLQDTSSSNRGSQQSGSHSQSKSASKSYNSASNWSY